MNQAPRGVPTHFHRRIHVRCAKAQIRAVVQVVAVGKSNIVQEANLGQRRMALYPGRHDWEAARTAAGLTSRSHDDMHAGEIETSLLLHLCPELVRDRYQDADHVADRPHLLMLGMRGYTASGVIGQPSLATADKGKTVLDSLTTSFAETLGILQHGAASTSAPHATTQDAESPP
jgi:creatinine amidohydrolase/Fe(II)-dependent formamide hydrolase-like protein